MEGADAGAEDEPRLDGDGDEVGGEDGGCDEVGDAVGVGFAGGEAFGGELQEAGRVPGFAGAMDVAADEVTDRFPR